MGENPIASSNATEPTRLSITQPQNQLNLDQLTEVKKKLKMPSFFAQAVKDYGTLMEKYLDRYEQKNKHKNKQYGN